MDVAIDYLNIKPSDMMVKAKGFGVARTYCSGKKAPEIETVYLGASKGFQYIVYDKTKQMLKKYGIDIGWQYTRIEARMKNKSIQELQAFNSFKKLQIFWAPAPIGIKDYEWRFFLNYAQTYSLQTALKEIPKQDKKKYEDRVKELACDWWKPETLLPEYKKQLQELITLFE